MKAGPDMMTFSARFGVPIEEVIEWVNCYVNGPWNCEVEPTKAERVESIKSYIRGRNCDSITERANCTNLNFSNPVVVHSCPF